MSTRHAFQCYTGARQGPRGQSWSQRWKKAEMRTIRGMCGVFPERKTAHHLTEKTPRCRCNLECDEEMEFEETLTFGKKEQCRFC